MEHRSEKFVHYCERVMLIQLLGTLSKDHTGNTMPSCAKIIQCVSSLFLRRRLIVHSYVDKLIPQFSRTVSL